MLQQRSGPVGPPRGSGRGPGRAGGGGRRDPPTAFLMWAISGRFPAWRSLPRPVRPSWRGCSVWAVEDCTRSPWPCAIPEAATAATTTAVLDAPASAPRPRLTLVTYGVTVNDCLTAVDALAQAGVEADLVKLDQIAPLCLDAVRASLRRAGRLLVVEEAAEAGCVGVAILAELTPAGEAAGGGPAFEFEVRPGTPTAPWRCCAIAPGWTRRALNKRQGAVGP